MPQFYLQFGLRPLAPKEERRTHSNEPGFFVDSSLHTFNKVENQLVQEIEADTWLEARAEISDVYTL